MWKEFRAFILRGNVIDLAVAVIIGIAFGAIVKSLIDDIIMPLVGIVLGGVSFAGLSVTVGKAVLGYGNFIQALVNFLIIALVLFLIIKAVNQAAALGKKQPAPAAPAAPPDDIRLLTEIRDLLKKR
jgi:large conductance mechanosensitive channel